MTTKKTKLDRLYDDYKFTYDCPIMSSIWKHRCYFCGKDLRKVSKQSIIKGEVTIGYGEDWHLYRHWWCNEECVRKWYNQQWKLNIGKKNDLKELNERIRGGK